MCSWREKHWFNVVEQNTRQVWLPCFYCGLNRTEGCQLYSVSICSKEEFLCYFYTVLKQFSQLPLIFGFWNVVQTKQYYEQYEYVRLIKFNVAWYHSNPLPMISDPKSLKFQIFASCSVANVIMLMCVLYIFGFLIMIWFLLILTNSVKTWPWAAQTVVDILKSYLASWQLLAALLLSQNKLSGLLDVNFHRFAIG